MNSETVPADLEQIRVELEAWRGQRRKGERIPEELWQRAADAVRVHGLNAVSCTLRLDYYQLKRRAGQDCPVRPATPAFVELGGAAPETGPELDPGLTCVVELQKGNGTRMRICVRDTALVDWGKLKEAFLGA